MEFTSKSRARLLFTLKNTALEFQTMVTLTYPSDFPTDGKVVKGHLADFLRQNRKDVGGYQYLWFFEFQKRGAPHIHILTTTPPQTSWFGAVRRATSLLWYEVVGSGDVKHLKAGTRVERIRRKDGAIRYAAKYASKRNQKRVPELFADVGRFWGASRGVKPLPMYEIAGSDEELLVVLDMAELPPYSTLFDRADIVMQRVPGVVRAQVAEIARYTGEAMKVVAVNEVSPGSPEWVQRELGDLPF